MDHPPLGSIRLGFGCVRLGSVSGGRSWRTDVRLIQEAVDRGVTLFDTADAYGNGVSEEILGRALRGRRSTVEIATKAGYVFTERSLLRQSAMRAGRPLVGFLRARRSGHEAGGASTASYGRQDFSLRHLNSAVDASLRRLGTDYLDVFQLHGPRTLMPHVVEGIEPLMRSGKIRRFGIGAESVECAGEWLAIDAVSSVQVPFGMLDPQAAVQLFPIAQQHDVELWARGVLGGGVLTSALGNGGRAGAHPKMPLVRALGDLADRVGVDVFRLAIDYVRSFPAVSTILLGISSAEHLDDNLRLIGQPALERRVIDEIKTVVERWNGRDEPG